MTPNPMAPQQAGLGGRTDSRDLRLLVDSLCELIGAGDPLDGMSRSRALGLVIGLERLLPPGQAGTLLDKLRHTVQSDREAGDVNGARRELRALMEQLQEQHQGWLGALYATTGSGPVPAR